MDMSKYRDMFLSEAREHLLRMGELLVGLEPDAPDRERVEVLFREAHSIKGMAAAMGYQKTAELGHHLEDFLQGIRDDGRVPEGMIDRLLAGVDLLEGLLDDLTAGHSERDVAGFIAGGGARVATVTAPVEQPTPVATDSTAVDVPSSAVSEQGSKGAELLQIHIELATDAHVPAARALLALRELEDFGRVLSAEPDEQQLLRGGPVARLQVRLQTPAAARTIRERLLSMPDVARVDCGLERAQPLRREIRERTVRVKTGLLDQFINLAGELITTRYMLQSAFAAGRSQDLGEGLDQLTRQIGDLHHQVLQVRMMPVANITGRLPRQLRELERKTGKSVRLHLTGEEVELDRSILEALADPLMHMLRNAVDHGIERTGEVWVSASREKDLVRLEVRDNGRGLDPDAIRRKAVQRGLLSEEQARSLTGQRLYEMICHSGFSTAETLSETSGRGVGMDVVKAVVEQFGGALQIDSSPGEGTSFQLCLPLSVAIIQVLLVECAGETVAIPLTRVLRTLDVGRGEILAQGRRKGVMLEETFVPLLSLRKMLLLPNRSVSGKIPVVVCELPGRLVGLVVDRLVGQRETFVKALTFPLDRMAGLGGATLLGDGRVVFIVDPQALLEDTSGLRKVRSAGEAA